MIQRALLPTLLERLGDFPAVALLGPRQCGKTTLALQAAEGTDALYLDLESEADRAKVAEPELYLGARADRLVILDEIHRAPGLFPVLRGLIDQGRREGRRARRFLILGSASMDLLKQSGESLAGRVSYLELGPLDVRETAAFPREDLWLRGGFPESLLARDQPHSLRWRQDFIRSYLERDIPQLGPRIAAETLRRFWTMLAHRQGALLNMAEFGRSLGVDVKTVGVYLDLMVDLLLVRRLVPWHGNLGKRLVKSPKIYVRDTGLLHALLGIPDLDALCSHPIVGASWEGFVIENLLRAAPEGVEPCFYRTSGGAEMDLVLVWPTGRSWAVEIKRSLKPKVDRGFHAACEDLRPERRFLVHPGSEDFPMSGGVEALRLPSLVALLASSSEPPRS